MSAKILIGSTGLVGTTLKESINFDYEFNSKNINTFINNDYVNAELYLSCLSATKWLVNKDITSDLKNIYKLIDIISKKTYSKIIIISTIDVYVDSPQKSDESYSPNIKSLSYGTNRYLFELLIDNFIKTDDLKIFRLPGLFNKHIKKNIIFDLINNSNIDQINLNSTFQWYNLNSLSSDILYFSEKYPDRKIFNLFPEPLETSEIIKLFPKHVDKVQYKDSIVYNFKTNLTEFGYLKTKESVLEDLKNFICEISISNLAWDPIDNELIFKKLNSVGITHIEGVLTKISDWKNLTKEKLVEFKILMDKYNISMESIQSIFFGVNCLDLTDEIIVIKHYIKLIEYCKIFGVKVMVLGSPSLRKNIEGWENKLSSILNQVDNLLIGTNIELSIEPNMKGYNGGYFFTLNEIVNFIEINGFKNIKTMIDTHNIKLEQLDPINEFESNIKHINHIHISEPHLKPIVEFDFHKKFSELLKKNNYNGIITYEVMKCKNLMNSVQKFQRIYAKI